MNPAIRPLSPLGTLLLPFLLAASGAVLPGQVRPIGYPQGATSGNWGYWGPLGESCSTSQQQLATMESRTHILIPAEYLPSRPGIVWALQHFPGWATSCGYRGNTMDYALLEIRLAHRPRGAGPLSTTFASNLPAQLPAPVFSQAWTKTWTFGQWNSIPFAQGFPYNGVDDLVIEIRKKVTPSGRSVLSLRNVNPLRAALPRQVIFNGGPGAASNPTGNYSDLCAWRLRFDQQVPPTLEVWSQLGPNNLHFERGTTMHWRIYDSALDLYFLAVSFGPFLQNPVPVPNPPIGGKLWIAPTVTFPLGILTPQPGAAYHQHSWTIPNSPALVGLHVYSQAVTVDSATLAADFTNAADFVIQ